MRRVDRAVDHRRRDFEVICARREQARAAVLRHHPQLRHDVLARVLRRQVPPEAEPADRAQLRSVIQHAPADPGDLVEAARVAPALVTQVLQVRGVVESVADPCAGPRGDDLRQHGSVPELDRALVRPIVVEEAQPDHGGAHEPAAGVPERPDEAAEQRRLEVDVVVQEQHVRRTGTFQERLAVFGKTSTRHVSDELDRVAVCLQDACHGGDLGHGRRGLILGALVGDDDTERRVILGGETRQGHG
ncbi:MAG TPA: hypothetical protein VFN41_10960 [Candidatus Limnocylindrales bacterium]|nr:hypothetical protein [Candidatus Limnocylindrales bacterium]